MWYQNLYILALNAAEGSDSAPGLYGSFVTADQMLWAGDLTLNYNAGAMRLPLRPPACSAEAWWLLLAEAPFYGALSANRPWLLDGYLETVYDIIDTASDLAKRQFPHCEPGAREPNPLLFRSAAAPMRRHDTTLRPD